MRVGDKGSLSHIEWRDLNESTFNEPIAYLRYSSQESPEDSARHDALHLARPYLQQESI
jgi:hypothetical protein